MLFSESIFLFGFLPAVLFCYYVLSRKSRLWQNILLTLASLFFYAWGETLFVFMMVLSITVNWFCALKVDKHRDNAKKTKAIIILMLAYNLSIFFVFKYLTFTLFNINSIFGTSISYPSIALPIGISFFTFQAISYVIDVYRQKGEVQRNIMNVALYISFFPQLIAGPIVRYQTVADQINNRKETFDSFADGCVRFMVGLGKKVIIANNLALIAEQAFASTELTVLMAWLGIIAFTLQIYFDFSGYSDMAIGLGKMFGFHFLENFNYPYISKSITEFWRRWHISLGSWFRDYIYFPLGGSRVDGKFRLVFNLFVVWLLTGIWHGANWTFIVWGLMYFALIAFEKLTGLEKKIGWFAYIYTMLFVMIGWVLFNSSSIAYAGYYISCMFGFGTIGLYDVASLATILYNYGYFILAFIFAVPIVECINKKCGNSKIWTTVKSVAIVCIFLISISFIVKGSYNPFIYFNF
ncbi:MAG: MBOAT family O-acyltransferase [Bacillota bacterium]